MKRVLSIIFGFISDPFRKVTSHVNSEKITKTVSKKQFIIYIITLSLTIIMALAFYLWT